MTIDLRPSMDLSTIEALDFEYTPPCEHSLHPDGIYGHSGSAWALIERKVCLNHKPRFFYICEGGWRDPAPVGCNECDFHRLPRDEAWRLVSLVRST